MTTLADVPGLVESIVGGPPLQVELGPDLVPDGAVGPVTVRRGRGDPSEGFDAAELTVELYADVLPKLPTVGDDCAVNLSPATLARFGLSGGTLGTRARRNLATNPRAKLGLFPPALPAAAYSWSPTFGIGMAVDRLATIPAGLPDLGDHADAPVPVGEPVVRTTWAAAAADADFGRGPRLYAPTVLGAPGGAVYTVTAYSLAPAAGGEPVELVVWPTTDAAGEAVDDTVQLGAWIRHRVTATAQSSGLLVSWRPVAGASTAGRVTYTSALLVEITDEARPYFDGDSSAVNTGWSGPAHDSVSTYTPGNADGVAAFRRFVGSVTAAKLDAARRPRPVVKVTAAGAKAKTARLRLGGVPWPVEDDGTRAARILAETGDLEPSVGHVVPPAGPFTMTERDVDSTSTADLFDELADSAGGELWERRDGLLAYLDADGRDRRIPHLELTASDVVGRPSWEQAVRGMLSDVTVQYGDRDVSPRPSVRVVDDTTVWHAGLGRYTAKLTTDLVDGVDANRRAVDLVGRRSRPTWRIGAVQLEPLRLMPDDRVVAVLRLDVNDLLTLTGLPRLAPYTTARLWLEGWTEKVTRHGWSFDLDVSDYGRTGAPPTVAEVPDTAAWEVWRIPPELSVLQATSLYFGDEDTADRVLDVPADVRVLDVPSTVLVDTYTPGDL